MASRRTVFGWMRSVTAWAVIIAAAGVLLAAVVVPRVAGGRPYTVLTGSMQPHLPPGTLVIVRPVPTEEIGVGSVITYQVRSGEPTVVTHRVVAVRMTPAGEPVFRTKGDANDVADDRWVRPVQVRGELWYAVPYLGHLSQLISSQDRQRVVYGIAVALVLYGVGMFVSAGRDRRRHAPRPPRPHGRHPQRPARPVAHHARKGRQVAA
ncbi:MAG TPA: signal peptidase I [Nocardioides sp.]|nr:signal peptidase I [Nocardioides sp.]